MPNSYGVEEGENMKTIGKQVADLREYYGYTQRELAREIDRREKYIISLEADETTPKIDDLVKIANAFDVSLDRIVGRKYYRRPLPKLRNVEFHKRVAEYRNSLNMYKFELAKQASITTYRMTRFEQGEAMLNIYEIIDIADTFQVPLDYLVGRIRL